MQSVVFFLPPFPYCCSFLARISGNSTGAPRGENQSGAAPKSPVALQASFGTRGRAWKAPFDGVGGDVGVYLGEIRHP